MPISPLPAPPTRGDPANFAVAGDLFLAALPPFAIQLEEARVEIGSNQGTVALNTVAAVQSAGAASVSAAQAAASAAAQLWVSGTSYAIGISVWSPVTKAIYRRLVAGAGATDPSVDAVNWGVIVLPQSGGGTGGTTAATARSALGSSATGDALFVATTPAVARAVLGAAAAGLNSDITGLTGLLGAGLTPVGAVIYVAFNYAPAGFLKSNGAAVAVATYGLLAAAIYCGDAGNPTALFGYRCNNTDGSGRSTTGAYIILPDGRAEFLRGWDDGRGVDSGRIFGSAQGFSVEAHAHGSSALAGANSRPVGGGSSESATAGSSTGSYGGSETRPRNLALLAIIKY